MMGGKLLRVVLRLNCTVNDVLFWQLLWKCLTLSLPAPVGCPGISGLDQLVELVAQHSARLEKASDEKRPAIELARSKAVENRDAALTNLQGLACKIDEASEAGAIVRAGEGSIS